MAGSFRRRSRSSARGGVGPLCRATANRGESPGQTQPRGESSMVPSESATSSRVNRPFVGIPTFLRSPLWTDLETLDADIAIMGAPTDEGSPFMPGARFGPRGIREHSMRFGAAGRGVYDPKTERTFLEYEMANGRLVDVGDADILP